jgi:malate/lactate dehydrogenase
MVSTLLEGEYGLKDVCLSVPCIVSQASCRTKNRGPFIRQHRPIAFDAAGSAAGAVYGGPGAAAGQGGSVSI